MLKRILSLSLCFAGLIYGAADAAPAKDYFPVTDLFEASVTAPEAYLGYGIGEQHISPAALSGYMRQLARESARVNMETIGYSHERNSIDHVYISSPENIRNLDSRLEQHRSASSAEEDILVLNLAYSVHGNEASGANAVPLVAYYLAASKDPKVKALLEKTIIILEPAQNPDGLGRFASWVNQHQGSTQNFDNNNRAHHEPWPSGRTNHYWFDLNRDWIFAVHPESKARIKAYQTWKPHVLGDYHEMGGDIPSYFFQPGHPDRTHPLTSQANQDLTFGLAEFHAKALDKRGQAYFTEERFDDLYYGKASAYPDATGAIGLLFEQSSVRGHARELGGEEVIFNDSVANQLTTSLSLIWGSDHYRDEILSYRFETIEEQNKLANTQDVKGYIFSDNGDPARAGELLKILALHNIPVESLGADKQIGDITFKKNQAWIVRTGGAQNALIHSLFEIRTEFKDSVFYDVSSWNLPLAFNLSFETLTSFNGIDSNLIEGDSLPKAVTPGNTNPVAYAISWNQFRAPHLLQSFLAAELHPRLAALPFSGKVQSGEVKNFAAGSIIVQPKSEADHAKVRESLASHPDINVYGLTTGLTPTGPDLGSRGIEAIAPVKPALVVGDGIRPTEAGEIRYAVDKRFGIPLTILDNTALDSVNLSKYTHILLADGSYKSWEKAPEILSDWVKSGGVLIAQKRAAEWAEKQMIFDQDGENSENIKSNNSDEETNSENKEDSAKRRAYQDYDNDRSKKTISGAVLRAKADLTHPLLFGFSDTDVPVFYNSDHILKEAPISYDMPLSFSKDELLITGYADEKQLEKIADTPTLALHRKGKGKIVLFANNSNFRAVWLGTERLYANALFFTQSIDSRKDD